MRLSVLSGSSKKTFGFYQAPAAARVNDDPVDDETIEAPGVKVEEEEVRSTEGNIPATGEDQGIPEDVETSEDEDGDATSPRHIPDDLGVSEGEGSIPEDSGVMEDENVTPATDITEDQETSGRVEEASEDEETAAPGSEASFEATSQVPAQTHERRPYADTKGVTSWSNATSLWDAARFAI